MLYPIVSWVWNFGDSTTFTGKNPPPHTYQNPGTYTVTLTVLANDGTSTATGLITVTVLPEIGGPQTYSQSDGNSANTDDPISTATGELYFDINDLYLGGPLPLSFSRYYASLLLSDGYVSSALGNNWMHNFDLRLLTDGTAASVVYYRGKLIEFAKSGPNWTLKNAEPIIYQLMESGSDFMLMDPSKNLISTFDSTGRLTRIEDRNGNALILTYTGNQLALVTDGLGRTISFTYIGDKLTRIQDDTSPTNPKRSISFSYTGENLTSYTDAEGNITTYSYTEAGGLVGLMISKTLPEGNTPFTQTYDDQGRVDSQSDGSGNTLTLAFDTPSAGDTTMTDALSNTIQHTHENLENFTQQVDTDGETFSLTYDANNRRTSLTDRLGDTSSISYHAASGLISGYTDALGNTISYTYTPQVQGGFTFYNLTRIDYPDGTSDTMTYDASGNILSLTDQAGGLWNFTYNAMGQVLTETNPLGAVTTFTYNADGTLATIEDHLDNTTRFTYDNYKRLVQTNFPDMTSRSFTYDNNDHVLTVTDENGNTTTFTFNNNGNPEIATDPMGNSQTVGYTVNNRLALVTDVLGKSTLFTYDALQRVAAVTNAAGETVTYGYNSHGWLTSITDPAGNTTTTSYDKEGVVSSITDPLNNTTSFTTDKLGRVIAVTSPLSNTISRTYDSMGKVIETTDPLFNTTSYTYDARGNLAGITLPETITTTYTRNALGLITRVTDPNGNFWDRTYDEMGRLVSIIDPLSNTTTYAYDNRSRVSTVTLPGSTLDITYDAAGNIIQKSYSDGTDLVYSYDDNNRLLTTDGLAISYDERGDIITCNGLAITRDDLGRVAGITLAPGKAINYIYNNQGLVSRVTDWAGGTTELTYDDAGQMTGITRPNGVNTQNTYDNEGRLVGINETRSGAFAAISLTRDGAGNITTAVRDVPLSPEPVLGTVAFSYNDACQVNGYTYDSMGRLTAGDTRTYAWNLASRLTSYTENNNTVSFTYDGLGMRLFRTAGGTTRNYVWNYALGIPSVSVVRQGDDDVQYYVHLPYGVLLYSIDASDDSRRFYHFDEMGNTLFLTDDTGTITDSYGITPYGLITSRTGTTDNPFTFMGAYGIMQEGDSGLYYVRARYYDSETSRFISRDINGNHTSVLEINPYSFLKNNPLLFTDVKGINAKVIQEGIHTSIAVDIWEGDKIIGSLELSFYPKVWKKSNIPWWKYITHAAGALTNMGWPSIFEVTFKWTPEGVGTAGKDQVLVPGNREADEKLARAMLNAIGLVHSGLVSNADIVRSAFPPTKTSYKKIRYSAYGYGMYRPMTQVCNDFTDEMLDIYFGENWHWGPIYFGGGLMDELKTYLSELEAKEAEKRYVEQVSKLDPQSQDINFHVHRYGAAVFDPADDSGIANLYPR